MKYTFVIEDNNKKARSIINMLFELKDDYDFIKMFDDELFNESNNVVKEELLFRQNYTLKSKQGKSWEQLENEL